MLLLSFYLRCNMWLSSTGQLLDNSYSCTLLQKVWPGESSGYHSAVMNGQLALSLKFELFTEEIPLFTVTQNLSRHLGLC